MPKTLDTKPRKRKTPSGRSKIQYEVDDFYDGPGVLTPEQIAALILELPEEEQLEAAIAFHSLYSPTLSTRYKEPRDLPTFYEFVRMAWPIVEPGMEFIDNKHIEHICLHLEAVTDGRIKRLLINIPPGHAKSLLVSVLWPAWSWLKKPEWRVLCGSYGMDLALRDAMKCRQLLESDWYRETFAPVWLLCSDQNLKSYYRNTRSGERVAVSVGGRVTGFRGNCLTGETSIQTEYGAMILKKLVSLPFFPRILSFNHLLNKLEWRRIVASRESKSDEIYEIQTARGHTIRATADHLFFVCGRGYTATKDLRAGDGFVAQPQQAQQKLPRVRRQSQRTRPYLLRLLSSASHGMCARHLRVLQCGVRPIAERLQQKGASWREAVLLLNNVSRPALFPAKRASVQALRQVHSRRTQAGLLQRRMQVRRYNSARMEAGNSPKKLRMVPCGISSSQYSHTLLLQRLPKRIALRSHARDKQSTLQNRHQLRQVVQGNAASCVGTRRQLLCGLWRNSQNDAIYSSGENLLSNQFAYSSYRRESGQQLGGKSHYTLPRLSWGASQVESDTVSLVRKTSERNVRVYDIQVEGNHNFFANEVLTHNCVIIDDPLNAMEAYSDAARSKANRWLDEAASNRLNDPRSGAIVIIMQRLHADDMSGHVLEQGNYEHLCLPSRFEKSRAYQTSIGLKDWREEDGELLFPELFTPEVMDAEETRMGPLAFAGQHQQRPTPAAGNMFKPEMFCANVGDDGKTYTFWPKDKLFGQTIIEAYLSFDTATKEKTKNDYTAGCLTAHARDGYIYALPLILKRMEIPEVTRTIAVEWVRWRLILGQVLKGVRVEEGAGTAVVQYLRQLRVLQSRALAKGEDAAPEPDWSKEDWAAFIKCDPIVPLPYQTRDERVGRTMEIVPFCSGRNVRMLESGLSLNWLRGLMGFPLAVHDDETQAFYAGIKPFITLLDGSPVVDDDEWDACAEHDEEAEHSDEAEPQNEYSGDDGDPDDLMGDL